MLTECDIWSVCVQLKVLSGKVIVSLQRTSQHILAGQWSHVSFMRCSELCSRRQPGEFTVNSELGFCFMTAADLFILTFYTAAKQRHLMLGIWRKWRMMLSVITWFLSMMFKCSLWCLMMITFVEKLQLRRNLDFYSVFLWDSSSVVSYLKISSVTAAAYAFWQMLLNSFSIQSKKTSDLHLK